MKLKGRNLIQPEDFSIDEISTKFYLYQDIIDNPVDRQAGPVPDPVGPYRGSAVEFVVLGRQCRCQLAHLLGQPRPADPVPAARDLGLGGHPLLALGRRPARLLLARRRRHHGAPRAVPPSTTRSTGPRRAGVRRRGGRPDPGPVRRPPREPGAAPRLEARTARDRAGDDDAPILDTMTDGVTVVDGAGRIMLRNPAAGTLVGDVQVNDAGALDVGGYDLRHPDGTSMTADDYLTASLAGNASTTWTCSSATPVAPDGRMLEVTARPIPGSDPPQRGRRLPRRHLRPARARRAGLLRRRRRPRPAQPAHRRRGLVGGLLEASRAGHVVPPAQRPSSSTASSEPRRGCST